MRTAIALLVIVVAPIGLITIDSDPEAPSPVVVVPSTDEPTVATTAAPAAEAEYEVSLWPSVTVVGADADQMALLGRALAKFRDFGLELPDVEVRYSDDEADCNDALGIFENSYTPWRLSICGQLDFITYHELAHAWEAANVDDETRERYLEARGLTTWNSRDASWHERGVEDAARLIEMHLRNSNAPLHLPIWQERLEAYELLVGRPSPLLAAAADEAVADAAVADEAVAPDRDVAGLDDAPRDLPGGAVVRETGFGALAEVVPVAELDAEPACVQSTDSDSLISFFDLADPMVGADYQRAFALPDGRVLWLFQDAFLPTPDGPELVHNAGLLQSGLGT